MHRVILSAYDDIGVKSRPFRLNCSPSGLLFMKTLDHTFISININK